MCAELTAREKWVWGEEENQGECVVEERVGQKGESDQ